MKTAALCLAASLAIGGSASAVEGGRAVPRAQACETLGELRAALKGAKFTTLNAGQFHLVEGAYIAVPPPSGLPPADGAVLVQIKDKSLVVWMSGNCASKENPMPISDRVVQALRTISPTSGEIAEPDDSDEERKL
jgi:hypothetical protein